MITFLYCLRLHARHNSQASYPMNGELFAQYGSGEQHLAFTLINNLLYMHVCVRALIYVVYLRIYCSSLCSKNSRFDSALNAITQAQLLLSAFID